MAMSARRGVEKIGNCAKLNRKELSSGSSESLEDRYSSAESLPLSASESERESEDDIITNEKAASWWIRLTDMEKNKRKTCMKIQVLSPFLFGIVPRGHEDKLINWSYECGLLSTKDVEQVVAASDQKFEAIQILENAFEVLIPLMKKRSDVGDILRHKNDIIKSTSYKSALLRAEDQAWFVAKRNKIVLPTGAKKDMATMALVLTICHFAAHVQLSHNKKNDVLKQYYEDCKLGEEKALELKEQGNSEFASENFRAAISRYTRAVGLNPFNHIMYGNRAQSFLNVDDYRHALLDAKRAVVLKPDWDKGHYRLKQAANAIYNSEGEKASFLNFCVGKEVLTKSSLKQNGVVKKENSEIIKEITQRNEDESSEESVPELVSADESDTSSGDSDRETLTRPGMPDLLDGDLSDSNESDSDSNGIDEGSFSKIVRANKKDGWESRRPKKISKSTLELLRKQNQGLAKNETEKDCEKSAAGKKQEKIGKPKKNKEVNNVEKPISQPLSVAERKTEIEGILREGSKALLDNFFQEASDNFGKALGFIDTGPQKTLGYGDKKYVIVLYAYGTALIGLDLHKELEAAKRTFQNIISSFKNLNFPLAYYGLGRIHYRQNRFPEAIKILEKGLSVISNSCSEICWPGTSIVIEETKAGNLTVSFEKILTNCKYPPKPDAICRFDNCTGVKKSIYCTDTDYKGYVRIICTDACLVEYHIHCWKKLKSQHTDKSTDKDFLDSVCFTSSCFGHVSTIQVYDTHGLKAEVQSDKPKPKKEKVEKNATTEPVTGTNKKKRSKKKEQEVPREVEGKQNEVVVHEEIECDEMDEKPSTTVPQAEEKDFTKDSRTNAPNVEDLNKIPESGMFVLKKDDNEQVLLPSKHARGKIKKKKTKNVQSLDEFLGRDNEYLRLRPFQHDDENYDEIPSQPFTREPPEGWMSDPFSIPPHLQHEAREIESSLATFSYHDMYPNEDPWKKDSIREYVYSAFINLLKAEGSLHVMSEPMRKLLNIMPEEARILVQKEGGLRDFLAKSGLFTVEEDIVTNFENKFISDLSKPQKKPQVPSVNILNQNDTGWSDQVPNKNIFENYGQLGSLLANTGDDLQHNNNSKIDLPLSSLPGLQNLEPLGNYSLGVNPGCVNSTTNTRPWSKQGSSLDKWVNVKEFVPMRKDINIVNSSEIFNKNSVSTGNNEIREIRDKSTRCMDNEVAREAMEYIANDVSEGITENLDKLLTEDDSDVEHGLIRESFDTVCKTACNEVVEMKEDDAKSCVGSVEPSKIASVNEEMVVTKENKGKGNIETFKVEPTVSALPDQGVPHVSQNKIIEKTNEQVERILNLAANSFSKEDAVLVESKVLKEKGVQSKPSTKNKITMTEAITDELEKFLRVNKELKNKNKEWQEKYTKAEKEHNMEMQNYAQKIERIQKHNEQEKQNLHEEMRKKDERIKKLQEQLTSLAKSEETHIQALKTEISKIESQHHNEKQQWTSEKESAEKLKSYSQQQAKRARAAEIQLLELQRDVNFSFFTRALQEAELTLHNISQILVVNSTPQFQELRQKWQRYIADCKLQFGRNKIMFEASIPQIEEGKPLSSLATLRIARPASYPGPPILHLSPGSVPTTGNKLMSGPPNIRPEANRGPSPVAGASSQSIPDTTVRGRSDSNPRPIGLKSLPTNPIPNSSLHDRTSGEKYLKKCQEQPPKGSNSFEKIMMRLSTLFPNYTRIQMTNFIKEVRASKNGSLTGLSFDDIVACVSKLVKEKEKQAALAVGSVGPFDETGASGFSGLKGHSNSSIPFSRSVSVPAKSVVATPVIPATAHVSPSSAAVSICRSVSYEDNPCVICHDEMTKATKNVSLDCGHAFHHECIKKWLTGEQSTCPTCRVHALLPDEFPQLK